MINPANPVPELTKRAIYAIDGSLYYRAAHDITQQASVIFASGDVVMNAGNNINIESVHQSRVIKEERSKKHYLIQSTIDQYDAIIMVNGKIEMTAGNNFIGSGVKLAASTGDVSIKAGEKATLEDKTGYAWNHRGATKKKLLGKSKVSVSWTTHETAQVEITAPGGTVYVSSKECSLEGGRIDGKVPMFRCDKLQIKAHKVTSQIEMSSSKTGFISHSFPLGDLISSDDPVKNLRDNTIAGQIKSLINMQGPLDLLPAVNVISTIPNLVADYNFLKGNQTTFSPESLVGALLSKYISASISFGNKKTTTSVTQSISTLSEVTGEQCSFSGDNLDIAANVKCQSIDLVANVDCKIHGGKSTIKTESTMKSFTFDVGVGLSGVSFSVSIGDGKVEQSQEQYKSGTYQATNITIKVNNKLEIENAQINGINVKVEALIIEIKQVVDSSISKSQSTGVSMGVNIGWTGGVTPILSVSNSESLQQSQVVQLISGISGEIVEITASTLVSNIAAIEATQDLKVKADSINYIALPTTDNIDTETQVTASVTPRADGKSVYYGSLYNRDGDKVMSIGWSSNLMEGIQDIRKGIESVLGSNSNDNQQGLKAIDQTNEQDKDNTDTNTNEEQVDNTKKEKEADQDQKQNKAQPQSEQSTNQNSKGYKVYDTAIGPNEPFIDISLYNYLNREEFDPLKYDQDSVKFVCEWDGSKLTLVDNEDINKLKPFQREKAAELMSNILNTAESTLEQLLKDVPISPSVKGFLTKKFLIADFSIKYFAKYFDGKEKGALPSDAAIQSMSNTFVNAIINVASGGAGGAGAVAALGLLGVSSPFWLGVSAVIGGVAIGNELEDYLTQKGTIRNEVVQNMKNAMSDTIKSTYIKFKGELNK
jgi:hypothetical protein